MSIFILLSGKSGQHARSVIIVKNFSAEFKIELTSEFIDAASDLLRLETQILVIVKSFFHFFLL